MANTIDKETLRFEIADLLYKLTRKLTEAAYDKPTKAEQFALLDYVERVREMEDEILSFFD